MVFIYSPLNNPVVILFDPATVGLNMSRSKLCVTEIKLNPNEVMVSLGVESQPLLPEEREHSSATPKGLEKGTMLFGELLSISLPTERKDPLRRTACYGN